MYCTNCGQELQAEDIYCGECGVRRLVGAGTGLELTGALSPMSNSATVVMDQAIPGELRTPPATQEKSQTENAKKFRVSDYLSAIGTVAAAVIVAGSLGPWIQHPSGSPSIKGIEVTGFRPIFDGLLLLAGIPLSVVITGGVGARTAFFAAVLFFLSIGAIGTTDERLLRLMANPGFVEGWGIQATSLAASIGTIAMLSLATLDWISRRTDLERKD